MLFGGDPATGLVLTDGGFLLAILPPGAFISLALFVAAKNALDRRRHENKTGGTKSLRPLKKS
jgi:electron transport complex protein RnfE